MCVVSDALHVTFILSKVSVWPSLCAFMWSVSVHTSQHQIIVKWLSLHRENTLGMLKRTPISKEEDPQRSLGYLLFFLMSGVGDGRTGKETRENEKRGEEKKGEEEG